MTTTKSNAEFIAECEEQLGLHGRLTTFQGVPVVFNGGIEKRLEEAIERLRAADAELIALCARALRAEKAIPVGIIVSETKEIAELKGLLRWLHDKMKADTWDFDDDVHNAWDHQVDCPEKQRIDQILQTQTPKEGDSDG